jgi:hypothetical protein
VSTTRKGPRGPFLVLLEGCAGGTAPAIHSAPPAGMPLPGGRPTVSLVWVSGRQAAALLSDVLPVREHARLVLRAGLAGAPVRASNALLYDDARVRALAGLAPVTEAEVASTFPAGLFVARLTRETRVDVNEPWSAAAERLAVQPRMPGLTAAIAAVRLRQPGGLPWVATVCGFVVLCAQATAMREDRSAGMRFDLAPPQPSTALLQGRRLSTRPGRPWLMLEPEASGLSGRGGR